MWQFKPKDGQERPANMFADWQAAGRDTHSVFADPKFVDADKLYPATNCGMAPLSRRVANGKLKALGAGAEIIRKELSA